MQPTVRACLSLAARSSPIAGGPSSTDSNETSVAALAHGSQSVSELAAPFGLSLTAVMKHVQVLEEAGLLNREKRGRVVNCTLSALPLALAAEWLVAYERFWR